MRCSVSLALLAFSLFSVLAGDPLEMEKFHATPPRHLRALRCLCRMLVLLWYILLPEERTELCLAAGGRFANGGRVARLTYQRRMLILEEWARQCANTASDGGLAQCQWVAPTYLVS